MNIHAYLSAPKEDTGYQIQLQNEDIKNFDS